MSTTYVAYIQTFRRPDFVPAVIQAVLHQTVRPKALIVYDCSPAIRASESALFRVLGDYAAMLGVEFQVVQSPVALCVTEGRLKVAEHAELMYPRTPILVMDDDVIVEPDYVEKALGVLKHHDDIGVVVGRLVSPSIAPGMVPKTADELLRGDFSTSSDWRFAVPGVDANGRLFHFGFGATMFRDGAFRSSVCEEVFATIPGGGEDRLHASVLFKQSGLKVGVMDAGIGNPAVAMVHLRPMTPTHYTESANTVSRLAVPEANQMLLAVLIRV